MTSNESQVDPVPEQYVEDVNKIEGKTMSLKGSSDENAADADDEEKEPNCHAHTIGSARTPWYGTAFVLLSEVMGSGVLSLPNAAVTLGWGSALAALPIFALFSAYSGWLLAKVKQEFPTGVLCFADAASELLGPRFGRFTKVAMLVNWGALAVYFLIATSDAIGLVYSHGFLACQMNRTLVAAILLVIPCQCRDFHSISKFLSVPSSVAVLTAITIIIATLVSSHVSSQSEANPPSFGDKAPPLGLARFNISRHCRVLSLPIRDSQSLWNS
jgi:Transmembrane amino acid transporter protein